MGGGVDQIAIEPENRREHAITQPYHALDDGVEDRLDVRGELAEDAQDFAGGCLLLQSLS
jgi:hypothetical protein